MRKAIAILMMIATLFAVSACATTDSSNGESKYKVVDVTTAKVLHERDAIFIDVRLKNWFDEGHVPGAVNIPFSHFNDNNLAKCGVCYGGVYMAAEMRSQASRTKVTQAKNAASTS